MFLRLVTSVGQRKKILSSHKESNLRPSDLRSSYDTRHPGRVSYELRYRPRSPKSLCGSVVEHQSANPKV